MEETEEKLAGAPGGDSIEADQVNQFLETEHQLFQKVQDGATVAGVEGGKSKELPLPHNYTGVLFRPTD